MIAREISAPSGPSYSLWTGAIGLLYELLPNGVLGRSSTLAIELWTFSEIRLLTPASAANYNM
jgi:hypothetical protein